MYKICINYDLIDKAREAKTGFSLHKFTVLMGLCNGLTIPFVLLGAQLGDAPAVEVLETLLRNFFISGLHSTVNSSFGKNRAIEELKKLSRELNNICIETDDEALTETYLYDVKYSVDFESFPPKIVQEKYVKVPVNDRGWGNNERPLIQEHVIGSRVYLLSYGEPNEKEGKCSLVRRRVIQ